MSIRGNAGLKARPRISMPRDAALASSSRLMDSNQEGDAQDKQSGPMRAASQQPSSSATYAGSFMRLIKS